MRTDNQPQPWEPGSFSSPQRAHAFQHLRDLPVSERSIRRAYADHLARCLGKPSSKRVANGLWFRWSAQDQWSERLGEWDAHVDALRREKVQAEQRAIIEKHQRALAGALTGTLLPLKVLLTRMGKPGFEQELEHLTTVSLIREVLRANTAVPALVAAERQAHGLTTAEIIIDDHRQAQLQQEREWTDRALANPKAVDLLVEYLNVMTRPTPAPIISPAGNDAESSTAQTATAAVFGDAEDDDA